MLVQAEVFSNRTSISWQRPRDRMDFFNSNFNSDTGFILGYQFIIEDVDNRNLIHFNPLNIDSLIWRTNRKTLTFAGDTLNHFLTINEQLTNRGRSIAFFLPDSISFQNDLTQNALSLELVGLFPEQDYQYFIYAIDSSQNKNPTNAERRFITTTDDTPPLPITDFRSTQNQTNQVIFRWRPTSDSRPQDTILGSNILNYQINLNLNSTETQLLIPQNSTQDSFIVNSQIIRYPSEHTENQFELILNFLIPNTSLQVENFSSRFF